MLYQISNVLYTAAGAIERIALSLRDKSAQASLKYRTGVPAGYDTIMGYLERRGAEPEDLGRIDGFRLAAYCAKHGIRRVTVTAPPCLQAIGIEAVYAYPVELLDDWEWHDAAVIEAVEASRAL